MRLGIALLVLGVVCAAGEAEKAYQIKRAKVRLELAKKVHAFAETTLAVTRQHVKGGVVSTRDLVPLEIALANARATRLAAELNIEEVVASGEAPRDDLAAPAVGGHDYVMKRLKIRMAALIQIHNNRRLQAKEALAAGQTSEAAIESDSQEMIAETRLQQVQMLVVARESVMSGDEKVSRAVFLERRIRAEMARRIANKRLDVAQVKLQRLRASFKAGAVTQSEILTTELQVAKHKADVDLAVLDRTRAAERYTKG